MARFLGFVGVLALAACAARGPGKVDFDATHDFSTYRSFSWISEHPMKVGPVTRDLQVSLESRIMGAIRARLERMGYGFVGTDEAPDFVVSFTVGSREQVRPAGYPESKAGGRWSWGTEYHGGAAGATYTQGVLAIDVFDAAERRPVWHGIASKRLESDDQPASQNLINEVVATILSDFPPDTRE